MCCCFLSLPLSINVIYFIFKSFSQYRKCLNKTVTYKHDHLIYFIFIIDVYRCIAFFNINNHTAESFIKPVLYPSCKISLGEPVSAPLTPCSLKTACKAFHDNSNVR